MTRAELLHSGHLYFVLKRAQAGFRPAQDTLLTIFCEVVESGETLRPAILAYLADALRKILSGADPKVALGRSRGRAGRPKARSQGDFPPIIVGPEDFKKMAKAMPAFRDWHIARHVHERLKEDEPLKAARASASDLYGVSEATVHRAVRVWREPDANLQSQLTYFQASGEAARLFEDYVKRHGGKLEACEIAASWRRESLAHFRRLGRKTAAVWPEVSPGSAWHKRVVTDEELARALLLHVERRHVEDHPAGISEEETREAFIRGFRSAIRRAGPGS